jgi:hypothetical protein
VFEAAGPRVSSSTVKGGSAGGLGDDKDKEDKDKDKDKTPFVSIHVLYYTQLSKIRPELSLSEPTFVVPHDQSMQGSSVAFAALLDTMLEKGVIAMVKYCGPDRKRKYPPRLAAMLPQRATGADAAGFNLVKLPYKGDLRANPAPVGPNILAGLDDATTDAEGAGPGISAVSAAEQMIQALMIVRGGGGDGESQESSQFTEDSQDSEEGPVGMPSQTQGKAGVGRYDYLDVEGPALQHFYSILESIALKYQSTNAQTWRPSDDRMVPNLRQFGKPVQKGSIATFKAATQLPDNALSLAEDKKRKSVYEPDKAEKKPKVAEMTPEVLAALKASDLTDFVVPDLKNHCKALGLPVGGKKAELIERITLKIESM